MKPDYKNWIPKGMLFSLIAGTMLSLALFPVFGGERTAAKIQTVKGLRVEFFSRCARENTTRPLTVRIAGAGGASVICERCRNTCERCRK